MAPNSGRGARRSSRLKKPPVSFSLLSAKRIPEGKEIRTRSTQNLRRSPRLKGASFGENSEQFVEEEAKDGKISNVEKLLKTGFLNGLRISCLSEGSKGYLPGIIKNGGFLCGCSQCGYNGEVLSAKMFEKHAGANAKFQTDHIFLRNNLNLYEVSQFIRNISEEDMCVKILKLRVDLKQKEFSEESDWGSIKFPTARRSKRKRREMGFQRSIVPVENDTSKRLRTLLGLKDAVINKELKVEEIFHAEDLLKTGLLEGASVTYISEKNQVELPGIIKGTGYVCGCSECRYTRETFSAGKFKEHARCNTRSPNKCILLSNKISIFEAANKLKGIHGNALENKLKKFISEVEFRDLTHVSKRYTDDELEKDKSSEGSNCLKKSFEGSRQVLKCYRRYNPERRLVDVQGLLSTGLLEGLRVIYKRNEARLEAYIRGVEYKCGCSSCNYTKVITAREIERHARELSDNPNENIYLDNGMTLYKLVKELKGMPLYLLGDFLQDKIKCPPNYNSFEIWKGSFKMIDDSPNLRSNFQKQPEVNSKQSSIQSKLMDEVSISKATQNIDKIVDTSDVGNDASLGSLDSVSDQCLNQPIESTNSNFQHCLVSEPIIVSNLDKTITPKGINNDLAEDTYPKNISQSKSKDEASFSEATENNWMGISSDMRDNNTLENLSSISNQSLNQPNESFNLNSQEFSDKPIIATNPAETIIDGQSEGINDLAEASMPKNTFHPYNVKFDTPGSSGFDTPGPYISEGMTVVHKDSLNIGGDECHLDPASRKRRSPRNIKFMKSNFNFHVCPSSFTHGIETTVQKVKFKFSGVESITASDVMEAATADPDYMPLQSGSKEGLTDEEKTSLSGSAVMKRRRDVYLHKRIFEEGGLPDGTVLTYRCHNKVLMTGVKEGNSIKCACHNLKFAPSQFEAHAGMGQKRQPYRHIYNSDGKTLHELSLELPDVSRPSSGSYSGPVIHLQHKRHELAARSIVKKDLLVPTRYRLKRVLLSQKGVLVRCTICGESRATLGDAADPKLVIFCNQCYRAYHIGCLEDQESFKIEDALSGNWFCCTDCTWVHHSLKNVCALGALPVPIPFLNMLKKPCTCENDPVNLSWQIFRGGNTEDHALLLQSLQFLKSVFKPILLGKQEMIRKMVFGKQVEGSGHDFRGVLFIMIKLNEEIVSIAVLRVCGKFIAELPLVATSKVWRRQGYFRMLLSLIEELLHLLQVRLLVSPVQDKMQSLWIDKFGFVKASDQKVDMLREQHGVMLFEDTALLEKEISPVAD